MKKLKRLITFILFVALITIVHSCKKEKVPAVETSEITELSVTRVTCGGEITSEGTRTVTERGVCWSTNIAPTIADNKTVEGAGAGSFTSRITGLDNGTTYYVRAYATNSAGTGYGMAMAFTTLTSNIPSVGLVAYYPFEGNADDQTSNENDGIVNGATLATDRFGDQNCAYYFDGISNMITGTTNNWPLTNSSRTISVWFKLNSLPANGDNNLLINYGPEIEHCLNNLYLQYTVGNGKRVFYGGYFDDIYASYNYEIDTWYNVITTFDGTNATMYINNDLVAQGDKSSWNTVSTDFHIGGWYNTISFINGTLDDIRIYNRVLSANEISYLYNEIP
jgi:hypothetical protein